MFRGQPTAERGHFNTAAGEASPEARGDMPTPPIRIVAGEIARAVDETEQALAALHVPVLVRGGAGFLCRPIADKRPAADRSETEVTLLTRMNLHSMSYVLNKHRIKFQRWNEHAKAWRYIDPPRAVVEKLLAKGTWPRLPHVVGVVTVPTLRPDGTVLSQSGYDPATKLWCAPAGDLGLPSVRDTREAAEAALALFKDLLSEFPFVTDLDRAVALAALMTPVLRGACDVTPLLLILATTPGSGNGRYRQHNCAGPEVSRDNGGPRRGGREAPRRADIGGRADYIVGQLHRLPWRGDALPDGRAPAHPDPHSGQERDARVRVARYVVRQW